MDAHTTMKMIEELSNARGASGFEDDVLKVLRTYGEGLGTCTEDSLRNLYFPRKENRGGRAVVQLDAHSDEVGFMVQAIKPNGTIQFIALGGWVANNLGAQKVRIRNRDGEYVSGIVASKPPHFMTEEERGAAVKIENLVIDVGALSREEVVKDFKIQVGAPIVPDVAFEYDEAKDLMMGKAFDCRLGCAALLDTMRDLRGLDLKVDLHCAVATQEEVGTRGAFVTANTIRPDAAIVFEGSPADDTFAEPYAIQTGLKRGPMLRHIDARMITNPRFQRYALDIAEKVGIPVQEGVRAKGATNGAPIHLSNLGVPVIVIGLPVRYIHTHHGIASFSDYAAAVKLAVEIIKNLDGDTIKRF